MPELKAACAECREIAANRSWLLNALGHPDCVAAIRAEQLAARTFWIRINPQGCVTGSALGEYVGPLAEDAHKEFTPKVADRRREAAEGWRHDLIVHAEWKQRAEACLLGRCQHRKASGAEAELVHAAATARDFADTDAAGYIDRTGLEAS